MAGTEDRLAEGVPHKQAARRTMRRPSAHPAADQDPERDERVHETSPIDAQSEDEAFAAFEEQLDQSVLPNLPRMDGYHVCWLTTTNPRDTVANRVRMGYELITYEMVGPGFEAAAGATPKSAMYPGVISINEMLAARIKLSLYTRIMRHTGEVMPRSEEEKLRSRVDSLKENAERYGSRVQEGDGMAGIVQRAGPMPAFEE